MKKIFLLVTFIFLNNLVANNVDCIMLEDEDSIVCKYTHDRIPYDHNVSIRWIEPDKTISRTREMIIPAYHGSIYDYRYKKGRTKGIWTFEVIDDNKSYKTNFTL